MLNLVWDDDAADQLESLLDYIAERNLAAAEKLESRIHELVELTREFSGLGRPGRVAGTRELVPHPNFIIIYQVGPDLIEVIRVLHARRRYP